MTEDSTGRKSTSWPRRIGRKLMQVGIGLAVVAVVIAAVMGIGSWQWARTDDAKARMTTRGPYQATVDSLRQHPLPAWFQDAKFGIMLHWGPYSVPGFAASGRTFAQTLVQDYDHALTRGPYAEDYANQIKDPGSAAAAYHRATFGDATYTDIARKFETGLAEWNPQDWAAKFAATGAGYVVVTAKYADGYSLWPTQVRNPHAPDFHSRRDLIGELAQAVRAHGMRFGVYYSGGVDWTFQPHVVETLGDYAFLPYGDDYRDYAEAQVRELVQRYKPDILWNDIAWPTGQQRLDALLADYYNTVPDGVVDDRWKTANFTQQVMGLTPMRWAFDQFMKRVLTDPAAAEQINKPAPVPHSDFRTTEYSGYDSIQDKFWQQDRGIGGSFGYNRQESEADYATAETLLTSLFQAAANNGALLLNVGPSGGAGEIVPIQQSRLDAITAWMTIGREALDGTRPWRISSATATDGTRIVFTRKGSDLYLIVVGRPTAPIRVKDLRLHGDADLLGTAGPADVRTEDGDTIVTAPFTGSFAPVVKVAGAA